jgi:hypothetical protein
VKRIILCGLLGGMLMTSTGCGLLQAVFCYRPCVSRGDCGPAMAGGECDDGCGPTCGPTRRPIRGPACAPRRAQACADCGETCDAPCARPCRRSACRTCGSCGESCGDPCADPCGNGCYGRPWHRGPLSCVFAWLTSGTWWGCSSCGERYWGDFYSDPPDCWDPCDDYGNYTGGGGCRNCGNRSGAPIDYGRSSTSGGRVDDGMPMTEGNIISQNDRAVGPAPSPASQPHRAARP